MAKSQKKAKALSFDDITQSKDYEDVISAIKSYNERLFATKAESPTGHLFVNGKHVEMNGVSKSMYSCQFTLLTPAMAGIRPAGTHVPDAVLGPTDRERC